MIYCKTIKVAQYLYLMLLVLSCQTVEDSATFKTKKKKA